MKMQTIFVGTALSMALAAPAIAQTNVSRRLEAGAGEAGHRTAEGPVDGFRQGQAG